MGKGKKLKIVFIIDLIVSSRAGTERQLIYLIKGLNPLLFDIQLICLMNTEWLKRNYDKLPCSIYTIEVYKFKKPSTYINAVKLARLISKINPDIVHSFFPISNVVGVFASRICGVKVIMSSRRDYGQWMTPGFLLATKVADKFVTRITTNSDNVRRFTSEKESFDPKRIDVLYNGIDLKRFLDTNKRDDNSKIRSSLNIPENVPVVGIVANLRPMKHLHTFIQAAAEILRVRGDIHFILIGRGDCRQDLENLVGKLNIRKNVHFAGSQKDVLPFLRCFDVGVNCSAQEGLSNAIMEYMAGGVPCIVSDAGGNNELIENEVNGLVFELDNYEELSSKILRLLGDCELQAQFVTLSKEKIHIRFSLDRMINNYEMYYRSLAGR